MRLFLAIFVPLCLIHPHAATAQSSATSNSPAKTPNNRYTLSHPNTPRNWTVAGSQVTADHVAQAAETALAHRLSQKGFFRVQSLDVQCCIVQLEVTDVADHASSEQKAPLELAARLTVFDVDRQSLYTKEYRVNAPTNGGAGAGQTKAATDQLVTAILADDHFLKVMAGK